MSVGRVPGSHPGSEEGKGTSQAGRSYGLSRADVPKTPLEKRARGEVAAVSTRPGIATAFAQLTLFPRPRLQIIVN